MPRTLKDINVEVGARIKEKRLARKLTREDLARLSGYTANFIQEVERGRSGLSSESIRALSMALKVSADSLLFGDVPEEFAYISQQLKSAPKTETHYPNYRRSHSMYKILTEIPSICFMERGIDVDELITKICKNDKVKWEMYGILMNAVCSIICGFLTDNMVLTAVYIGVTAIIDILSEIELEMEGLVNWEKIISRIFEINNWIKYLIFVVFALLPVICGVFTKEIAVSGIKDFRSVIFVNVFPNVCGSLIVCSLVAHISKLNERQFISALIKSKRSLFNIIIRGIFFACYLNAVNYNAADNWKYANYVNSIYLFFIISSGSIAVVSFLSRLVDDQPFPYTAKKVFPQWTLSFSVLFLFSCGAAPLIAKTGKHEPFLLLFNTITAIVLFGALLHFVIRKTNQVDKAYPYGEFVIFFLLVSANCAVNFFKWDRWEQTGDIGSQIVSGVLILVITIIILLYLSYRQNENLKKLQEEKNKIATDG